MAVLRRPVRQRLVVLDGFLHELCVVLNNNLFHMLFTCFTLNAFCQLFPDYLRTTKTLIEDLSVCVDQRLLRGTFSGSDFDRY